MAQSGDKDHIPFFLDDVSRIHSGKHETHQSPRPCAGGGWTRTEGHSTPGHVARCTSAQPASQEQHNH